jgi:hypothetical protein
MLDKWPVCNSCVGHWQDHVLDKDKDAAAVLLC